LDGKTVDVTQFNGRQVILKSGGKVITKSVMKLKHGDVFRLAAPGQQKLGVEGYANLWQFALNAGGARKDLFPIVTEMVKAAKVDITAVEMQRLKPVFLVKTQPQGATIRMRSYEHDQNTQAPWLEPGTNEPPVLFSPFSRDATLDRTYILEISKKGYLTVDHGVRIQRTGRQFIDVKLKKAEGFVNLFAGEAARGWVQCGPGEFQFGHGLATATGGMGLWWYKPKEFINFVLRLEYVLQENANSGVFLRFPAPGNDPENALRDGYEVAILKVPGRASGIETGGSTGSIFAFKSPWSFPQRPAQKWNSMEITCVEQDYFVRLNGELVNHFVGDRKLSGHIGLQNYRTLVSFRNVHIKELKGAEGYNEMVKLSREIEAAKKE
ncbi:MAG: DUF1080 domain-containing protein, partial [Planctomycetota bacterium]|nr:DUF1080 domain-containing protein [Planctomycetota bacterium]